MNIKRVITDSVICLLLAMNVFVGVLISDSMKPKCIIDGCNRARCERSYYCGGHTHAVSEESVIYYGKR